MMNSPALKMTIRFSSPLAAPSAEVTSWVLV
jgi:hypothetical protein